MNLWAAIVCIVELFIRGGKPGHALVALLAAILAVMVVAVGLTDIGRFVYAATFGADKSSKVALMNNNPE